jgi:two-component sensor histidine kinase
VRMLEFTRITTFRWTLAVSGAFIVGILLMFGFILVQAHSMMTTDVDASNNEIANAIASHEPEQRISGLDQYLRVDPHHVKLGGLFAADGRRIAGNIETLPATLHADSGAQFISMIKMTDGVSERHAVRAVARGLPEGGTLVIARSDYEFTWIVNIVERALAVGIMPALCLSLAIGVFLSIRAQKRIGVDQAMAGLDQSLATIAALLRISEIEHSRRVDGFRNVPLADLVHEVGDLYEPIAEDKKLDFGVRAEANTMVHGDRDLLFEAIANLVDNAIKFTPQGGRVELSLLGQGNEAVVRVCDTGPGIPANESELVTRRFYRSDNGRREPGLGLGLTLVSAIAKLHGFNFRISSGPGCIAEIAGRLEGMKCLETGALALARQGIGLGLSRAKLNQEI